MAKKKKRSLARSGRGSTRYHLISCAERTHSKPVTWETLQATPIPSPAPLGSDFKPTAPRTRTNRPLSGSRKSSTTLRHSVLLRNKYNTEKRACQVFFIGNPEEKRKKSRQGAQADDDRQRQKPQGCAKGCKRFCQSDRAFLKKGLHLQKNCDILKGAKTNMHH